MIYVFMQNKRELITYNAHKNIYLFSWKWRLKITKMNYFGNSVFKI